MKFSLKFQVNLLLTLFFLIRIIYSYFWGWTDPNLGDGVTYNNYALAILNQPDWLINPIFHGSNREPIYPIFLSLIYAIFGTENLFAVYFFQSILSTLTVYYIFKLSADIFNDKRKSLLALSWAGFYVFYIMYTGLILRESLVQFLVIFSFYHLWGFLEKKEHAHFLKNIDLWKFIITFAILLHTDARYLFYIPFISILFMIYKKIWTGVKQYSLILLILILLLVPWTVRNYIASEGFVLINTMTLDMTKKNMSTHLELLRTEKMTVPYSDGYNFSSYNKNYPTEEERALIKQGKNPNNRPEHEINLIMRDVYPESSFIGRKLYYAKSMWLPFRFRWDYQPFPHAGLTKPWSFRHNFFSISLYGTLLPFATFALFNLFKKRDKAVWFLIFPILVHLLLHFLMFGEERYRNQIDSFNIILGCYGIVIAAKFVEGKLLGQRGA